MTWRRAIRQRTALRAGLFSWVLTSMLVVVIGADPYAAAASPLQLHGALQRAESDATGVISHRGAAAVAPENTLAAFGIAIAQGVDFVETDVRLTADGVPVLMHDADLDRTTDGRGLLAARTLAEVRELDAGGWFDAEFAGEPVPTLEEFLDLLVPAPTRAFIELKGEWAPGQVAAVVQLLRDRQLVNRVVLESFEEENLEMLLQQAPEFARMLLTRDPGPAAMRAALELQVSAVGAREERLAAAPEFVAQARAAGMGAVVYTLNTERQWERAAELGIDFIITDDPVSLAEWRSARLAGPDRVAQE